MTTDALPVEVVVSLALTGLGLGGWGVLVALRTPARPAGLLLGVSGAITAATALFATPDRGLWMLLALAGGLLGLAVMFFPRVHRDWPTLAAVVALIGLPLGLWWQGLISEYADLAALLAAVPLLQAWWRLEAADADERRALSWVLAAAVLVCFLGVVVGMLDVSPVAVAIYLPSFTLIGGAAWVGATRPGAVDVRGLVTAMTTHTLAAIVVFTVFQLGAITLEAAGAIESVSPVAGILAAACAFLLAPLRALLRLVADEILFGVRPDPLVAAGRVALGVGADTQTALDTLCAALVLPFAELRIEDFSAMTSGQPTEHLHTEPLFADGRRVGDLVVGLRPGDLRLPAADATVISLAAPLLAETVRARALAAGLQESRSATASAREEERRRLRRDLHDGLGPRLVGIAFTADAAQLSADDRDLLAVHLARVRAEAVTAIREIREIVHELRPPALDEVGLVEAIRLQASALMGAGGRPMSVVVSSEPLPVLSAAVEVAVYRITTEALTNAARHSGADCATASLCVRDHALHVAVRDDGTGSQPWRPGVGLRSMTERAQELGGSLTIKNGEVRAVLPV